MPDNDITPINSPENQAADNNREAEVANQLQPVDDNGLPDKTGKVFYYAMVVGGLVMFAGIFLGLYFVDASLQSNVLVSIGGAVFLAAFGGQAKVFDSKVALGGSIAGAAVIFVGISWMQNNSPAALAKQMELETAQIKAQNLKKYSRVSIRRIKKNRFKNIEIQPGVDFMGNYDPVWGVYYFSVFGDLASKNLISIYFDPRKSGGNGREGSRILVSENSPEMPLESTEIVVHVSCLELGHETQKDLSWELHIIKAREESGEEIAKLVIRDSDSGKIISRQEIGEQPRCQKDEVAINAGKSEHQRPATSYGWISAHAQALPFSATAIIPPLDLLKKAIVDLDSRDKRTRRSARELLSHAPLSFVPEMLKNMRRNEPSYGIVLGTTVALTLMLRRDKKQAAELSKLLNREDHEILIKAAAHKDRTLRNFATEFLYDLGDPILADLAIKKAAETTDAAARYNLIFSAQDGWQKLTPTEKSELKGSLDNIVTNSGPKTKALVDRLK